LGEGQEPGASGDGAGDGCVWVKKTLGWCSRVRSRRQQTSSSLAEKTARDPSRTSDTQAARFSIAPQTARCSLRQSCLA
jgi:hypothetical protein